MTNSLNDTTLNINNMYIKGNVRRHEIPSVALDDKYKTIYTMSTSLSDTLKKHNKNQTL